MEAHRLEVKSFPIPLWRVSICVAFATDCEVYIVLHPPGREQEKPIVYTQ